jgi:predicted SprT family Zn-dependent metalloprotease
MDTVEKKLQKLKEEAIKICEDAKIPIDKTSKIKINTRAKKRYGLCSKKNGMYTIEISKFLFESTDEKIMQTILHEYLHTCKNCLNHGKQWKQYADILNKKHGYKISRTNSRTEMGLEDLNTSDFKYILRCSNPSCNVCVKRMKLTKTIKYYNSYRCGKCGSKLVREK